MPTRRFHIQNTIKTLVEAFSEIVKTDGTFAALYLTASAQICSGARPGTAATGPAPSTAAGAAPDCTDQDLVKHSNFVIRSIYSDRPNMNKYY